MNGCASLKTLNGATIACMKITLVKGCASLKTLDGATIASIKKWLTDGGGPPMLGLLVLQTHG